MWDLVREHLVDRGLREKLGARLRARAIIKEDRKDAWHGNVRERAGCCLRKGRGEEVSLTRVIPRRSEEPGTTAMEDAGDLFRRLDDQGTPRRGVARHERAVCLPSVHGCQILFHGLRRQEVDVLQAQRLTNVLLDVIVEGQPGLSLEDDTSPVDTGLRTELVSG